MARYLEAFAAAVRVFGRGQVSTYLIAGLGDHPDSIVAMAGQLAELGVYPFVVPFVPIAGTPMADRAAPSAAFMDDLYRRVAARLGAAKLSSRDGKAGLREVRGLLGALLLRGPSMTEIAPLVCRLARDEAEREEYFALRRTIFCAEQGLFAGDDRRRHRRPRVSNHLSRGGRAGDARGRCGADLGRRRGRLVGWAARRGAGVPYPRRRGAPAGANGGWDRARLGSLAVSGHRSAGQRGLLQAAALAHARGDPRARATASSDGGGAGRLSTPSRSRGRRPQHAVRGGSMPPELAALAEHAARRARRSTQA